MAQPIELRNDWHFGYECDFPKRTNVWQPIAWADDRVFDREVRTLADLEAWIQYMLLNEVRANGPDFVGDPRMTSVVSCTRDLLFHLVKGYWIDPPPLDPQTVASISGIDWFTAGAVRRYLDLLGHWCRNRGSHGYQRMRLGTSHFPSREVVAGILDIDLTSVSRYAKSKQLGTVGNGKSLRYDPDSVFILHRKLRLAEQAKEIRETQEDD